MKFRTEVNPGIYDRLIEHNSNIFTIGSCFAENVAEKFRYYRFNINVNPFGVLYNPVSVLNGFKILSSGKNFKEDDLVYHNNTWHSFYHNSEFSSENKEKSLFLINNSINKAAEFFRKTDWIIITYGTSWIFRWLETGKAVSNCHKIPQKQFKRERLSVEENIKVIGETISIIRSELPDVNIILTVSPVRHWKDGAVENQLSKGALLLAINNVIERFNNLFYFPSYEIVLDDLRDYRFYADDLVHPNSLAVEYIWEKFSGALLSGNCGKTLPRFRKLADAVNHRPFDPESEQHQHFLRTLIRYTEDLTANYPYADLTEDIKHFRKQQTEKN